MDIEQLARDILAQWDEWDAEAGQDAQIVQDPQAYDETMITRISECIEAAQRQGEP